MEVHKHSIHLGKKIGIDIGVDVTWEEQSLFTHTLFNKPIETLPDKCYAVKQDLAFKPDTDTSDATDAPEKSLATGETSAKAGAATSKTTKAENTTPKRGLETRIMKTSVRPLLEYTRGE